MKSYNVDIEITPNMTVLFEEKKKKHKGISPAIRTIRNCYGI